MAWPEEQGLAPVFRHFMPELNRPLSVRRRYPDIPDDLRVPRNVRPEYCGELLRRASACVIAAGANACRHDRCAHRAGNFAADPAEDVARRPGGREQSHPAGLFDLGSLGCPIRMLFECFHL